MITDIEYLPRSRIVHLENGNKYIVSQTDPFGFWEIHMEKGQIPESMKQVYTEADIAIQHIETHVKQKGPDKKNKE